MGLILEFAYVFFMFLDLVIQNISCLCFGLVWGRVFWPFGCFGLFFIFFGRFYFSALYFGLIWFNFIIVT